MNRGWDSSHSLMLGCLCAPVVVADHLHVQAVRDWVLDIGEELLELDRAMASVGGGNHGAIGHVQRGEQGRGAVQDVVVGALLGHLRHHRERRLGPGPGRARACTRPFSSTLRTTAFSGGFRQRPTMDFLARQIMPAISSNIVAAPR